MFICQVKSLAFSRQLSAFSRKDRLERELAGEEF
jgi:hypothetical protein